MAGQPLKRKCFRALDKREEEVFDRLAGGEYVTNLCQDVLREPYEEEDRGSPNTYHFYNWLDDKPGRRDHFDRVRESAADAVAEESVQLLDEAREEGVSSTAEATLARSQSNARQWWASKLNQSRYGNRPEIEANINLGELHLNALRKLGHMDRSPARVSEREEPEEIEGEYEEVEDGELPRDKFAKKQLGDLPGD